jgi:anti-anti-sigma factor
MHQDQDIYPVQWTGRQAVVALPEHIDLSNAGQIREELLSVINRGATALIADMTATISCDNAGADAVLRAHRRAAVSGTELRLVVTAKIVRRLLSLSGIDRLVSTYPSLEAATAAGTPAPVLALVGAPAGTRTNGQPPRSAARTNGQPPRRAARTGGRPPPAGPSDAGGAPVTPAVVWKLLDALHDGVALAAADGAIALTNSRLAEMFGYQHAELLGHPVEYLIPAHLQDTGHSRRASRAPGPGTPATGTGARLAGRRKDGTVFPVEVSFSPVMAAAGQFTVSVIRDVSDAQRLEVLADLARAAAAAQQAQAAAAQQAQRGQDLLDTIVTGLFQVGLGLQAASTLPADAARQRIAAAIRDLDEIIRQIRDTAFTARDQGTPPRPR